MKASVKLCSLFSGSSGNCVYVAGQATKILVDCGVSGKHIAASLNGIGLRPEDLDALLVTHEHIDHIRAVGVLSRRYNLPIYATRPTWLAMWKSLGRIKHEHIFIIRPGEMCRIGDLDIQPFSIPHDAAEPVGYSFHSGRTKLTVATDIGHLNDGLLTQLKGSDMVLIESNHDEDMLWKGRYPHSLKVRIGGERGHLSNISAARISEFLIRNGTKHFLLGHLSEENNLPDKAYTAVHTALTALGAKIDQDFSLEVAGRYNASRLCTL